VDFTTEGVLMAQGMPLVSKVCNKDTLNVF
jgi:hypothetical protein